MSFSYIKTFTRIMRDGFKYKEPENFQNFIEEKNEALSSLELSDELLENSRNEKYSDNKLSYSKITKLNSFVFLVSTRSDSEIDDEVFNL